MELAEVIIQKIKDEGPVTFHDFMEMALYYPKLGYYTCDSEKFGKHGDYYTSPLLSNIYGQMIGVQLEEMWQIMDKNPLAIVEYGAVQVHSVLISLTILNGTPHFMSI